MTELKELISKYPSLKYNEEKTKIVCDLTGHEMPPTLKAVKVYVEGKKYKYQLGRLSKQVSHIASISESNERENGNGEAEEKADDSKSRKWIEAIKAKYAEFLIPPKNPKRKHQLFCKLTLRHLTDSIPAIQQHITGQKFVKAYNHWLHCKETNQKFQPFSKKAKLVEEKEEEEEEGGEDIPDFLEMERLADSDLEEGAPETPEEDEAKDDDNLSDIFPYELKEGADADDDEEDDEEEIESEEEEPKPQKRKRAETKKESKGNDKAKKAKKDEKPPPKKSAPKETVNGSAKKGAKQPVKAALNGKGKAPKNTK